MLVQLVTVVGDGVALEDAETIITLKREYLGDRGVVVVRDPPEDTPPPLVPPGGGRQGCIRSQRCFGGSWGCLRVGHGGPKVGPQGDPRWVRGPVW